LLRRAWVPVLVLVSMAGCSLQTGPRPGLPATDPLPNVVVIVIDTVRADMMGAYGFEEDTTPELDALARKGVLFKRVVAQTSWTRPSMGSMLTGCYPRTIGIYKEPDQILPDAFTTLAEAFQAHGYETIGVHSNPNINAFFNFQQGFDTYVDSELWHDFMHPEPGQKRVGSRPLASAPELFDKTFEILGEGQGDRPRYVQLLLMDVHEWYREERNLTRDEFEGLFPESPNHEYLAPLRQTSLDIQAFIDRLVAMPGWENTLFVITSDHGEGLDSHPDVVKSTWHGRLLYESQLIVPLIFYNPLWESAGIEVTRRIRLMDLMPTLLEYVGAEIPQGIQGRSVLALMDDPGADIDLPEYFVVETELRSHKKLGVYGKDWKYFENPDGHEGTTARALQAMGILENGEKTDQLGEHPEIGEDLRAYLNRWRVSHRKSPPVAPSETISEETKEQLRAIGYLGD
jgi:arylsulfatase A-like enzyme